jgi:hypothetical protein
MQKRPSNTQGARGEMMGERTRDKQSRKAIQQTQPVNAESDLDETVKTQASSRHGTKSVTFMHTHQESSVAKCIHLLRFGQANAKQQRHCHQHDNHRFLCHGSVCWTLRLVWLDRSVFSWRAWTSCFIVWHIFPTRTLAVFSA